MDLQTLTVRLKGNAAHYRKTLRAAEIQTQRFARRTSDSVKRLGTRMSSLGKTLTTRITMPLAAMGAMAVKSFADFNQAMTHSMSIMGDLSSETQKKMRDLALELGKGIKGPKELAESYYFLASAGLSARESMERMPTVMRFSVAGAFDMARATDLLTDAQTALGPVLTERGKDMRDLGDHIVLAAKQANASVEQFAEAITSDAGVAARDFGMEIETLAAVLGAYASSGKKAAEAGNMLGRATRLLKKSYADNAEVFQKYGIEVVNKITGGYNNFIEIIGDLENQMNSMTGPQMSQFLKELGFEALAQRAILPLHGMTDAMREWQEAQKDATGTLDEVYQKQLESFTNQMKSAWNTIKVAAIEVGETLAPMILKMVDKLKEAVKWWTNLSDGAREAIVRIAALVAIGGPLMLGLTKLTSMLGALMAGSIAAKGGLIGAAIVGIGALSVAIYNVMPSIRDLNAELSRAAKFDSEIRQGQKKRRAERESEFAKKMVNASPKEQHKLLKQRAQDAKNTVATQKKLLAEAEKALKKEKEEAIGQMSSRMLFGGLGMALAGFSRSKTIAQRKEGVKEMEERVKKEKEIQLERFKALEEFETKLPGLMQQRKAAQAAEHIATMEQWDALKKKAKEVIEDTKWEWSYFTNDLSKSVAGAFSTAKNYVQEMVTRAPLVQKQAPQFLANEVVRGGTSASRELMERSARLAAQPKKGPEFELQEKQLEALGNIWESLQDMADPLSGLRDLFEIADLSGG